MAAHMPHIPSRCIRAANKLFTCSVCVSLARSPTSSSTAGAQRLVTVGKTVDKRQGPSPISSPQSSCAGHLQYSGRAHSTQQGAKGRGSRCMSRVQGESKGQQCGCCEPLRRDCYSCFMTLRLRLREFSSPAIRVSYRIYLKQSNQRSARSAHA
jgi:hypothetical protein